MVEYAILRTYGIMTTRQTANKIITLLIEGGTLRRNVWAADITQELALEAVEFPTTFKIDIAGQRVYRTTIDHDFLRAFLDVRLAGRLRMVERLGNNFVTSKIDTISLDESVIRNVYMLVQSGQVTHVSNFDPVVDPSLFDVNSDFDPGVLVISQEVEIVSANVSQVPHIQNPQVPDHINTDFVGTDDSGPPMVRYTRWSLHSLQLSRGTRPCCPRC